MSNFAYELLNEHNAARAQYGNVPPLSLDENLNHEAQNYAEQLANMGSGLIHSQKPGLGENLYMISGMAPTPADVANLWMSEAQYYTGSFSMNTGHFTQMVWKESQTLGVGIAPSPDGMSWYVVCNYHPPGNMMNTYHENVFMPGQDSGYVSPNYSQPYVKPKKKCVIL